MNEEFIKMSQELNKYIYKDTITDDEATVLGRLYFNMMKSMIPQNLFDMMKKGEQPYEPKN